MYNQTKLINRERKMNLEQDEDLKQDEELYALKKYVHVKKVDKKNIFKNLAEYTKERVNKRHSGYFDFLVYEKEIREKLQEGFTVQSVWYCLKKDGFIDCSLKTFQRYLNIKNEKPKKIKQTIQEDTSTEKIEDQKPEEIETEVEAKASQNQTQQEQETTQTVEPEKSDALKRIEEHRQRVQAQRAAEATAETKTEQQIETNAQQDTQETEEREFGKLPKGKVWSELSEELKETIRSERRQLDAEEREKRKQQQIEAAVAEREASKLHHNPNT